MTSFVYVKYELFVKGHKFKVNILKDQHKFLQLRSDALRNAPMITKTHIWTTLHTIVSLSKHNTILKCDSRFP